MKILRALALPAILLSTCANAAFEGPDHTLASLLLGEKADLKFAAEVLGREPGAATGIHDLAAELMWRGCVDDDPTVGSGTQLQLAVALGNTRDTRYWDTLEDCEAEARNDKVAAAARQAVDRLPGGAHVPQFVPGKMDLEAVRAALAASVARDAARRAAGGLAGLAIGQPMAAVYARYGLPDTVEAVSIDVKGILATYANAGTITFQSAPASRGAWTVAAIAPAVAGAAGTRVAQVRQWLANAEPRRYKKIAKELIARQERDRAVLDEVARAIDRGRHADDREADGYAWLCRVLGASGDGRYWEFLDDLAETAASSKLRGHAGSEADRLPTDDPHPFKAPKRRPRP